MTSSCQDRADLPDRREKNSLCDAIAGCLLGTAVGDAVGLVCEGYPRRRQRAVFGDIAAPRLLPGGRGMVSDDTEHTLMVAQALIASGGEPRSFAESLASQLRWWLWGLPAGTGKATLQACLRLFLRVSPHKSGVPSAGNGPAMRSALLGVCYGHEPERLAELVKVCTHITHTDPKAEAGSYAVALAAHLAAQTQSGEPRDYLDKLREHLHTQNDAAGDELVALVERAIEAHEKGQNCLEFADSLSLQRGVGGYIYHTVPVVLLAWFRYPRDLRAAVLELVHCGGDTDSTAAIAGAIIGAGVGRTGVPADWIQALWEWPRNVAWMEGLAERLAASCGQSQAMSPLQYSMPLLLLRNLCFFLIVLVHAARRLLPPY